MLYATRDKKDSVFSDHILVWKREPKLGRTMWHSLKIDGLVEIYDILKFKNKFNLELEYGEICHMSM